MSKLFDKGSVKDGGASQISIKMKQKKFSKITDNYLDNQRYTKFESSVVNKFYNNDNSRTVNQTNNSPKSLSRLEIYRLTRNAVKI